MTTNCLRIILPLQPPLNFLNIILPVAKHNSSNNSDMSSNNTHCYYSFHMHMPSHSWRLAPHAHNSRYYTEAYIYSLGDVGLAQR